MYLGIEIGGTKLQLGVGGGDDPLEVEIVRRDVDPARGAQGILQQIAHEAPPLIAGRPIRRVGIGFGGPVDMATGCVRTSHHVSGWDDFPLADWCGDVLRLPATLGNDADLAALAEARFGAGRGKNPVFYVTVGTGVGGGLVLDGNVYRGGGAGAAELGHLRPGLNADRPEETVESVASGWGIAAAIQARLAGPISHPLGALRTGVRSPDPDLVRQRLIEAEEADEQSAADLLRRCDYDPERLTAKIAGEAAAAGNALARQGLLHAWQVLGWGIAQMITLLSPQIVVLGGGLSLLSDELFLEPLREAVDRYVFPPFLGNFGLERAMLGEAVVVHGALALARDGAR